MTGNRADALAQPDVFVGEWVVQASFSGSGAWETSPADGGEWKHDFGLTYRRAG